MKDKHRLRLSSQIHAYSSSNQQELDRFNNNISHRNKAVRRLFLALDREAKRFTDVFILFTFSNMLVTNINLQTCQK